jgi:hypothetical protein
MKSFAWQTAEYVHTEKSNDWYWTVGIITAALVIVSIIFGNPLFAIVLAIGTFTLTIFASRHPNTISVQIDEKGLAIDKTLYPFPTLDSFYLDENHYHGPRLILKSKKVVMPLVSVPVKYHDLNELRAFLISHLKEQVFNQSVMQTLLERLGF